MSGHGTRRIRTARRGLAVTVAMTLAASLLTAEMPPPAYTGKIWSPFPLPATSSVPGTALSGQSLSAARAAERAAAARVPIRSWRGTRAARSLGLGSRWPATGAGTAGFGSDVPTGGQGRLHGTMWRAAHGWQRAGSLPVLAEPAGGQLPAVRASIASQRVARALGLHGVVFTVAAAGGTGSAHVALSYAGFGAMYGGGWSSRLRLVQLPSCALAHPGRASCRHQTPIASVDHWRARQLRATVTLGDSAAQGGATPVPGGTAAGAGAGAVILAAVAGASGPTGDFTATALRPSGSWSEQQGAFTYSYPINVPTALAGANPQVSLSYDSQAVDSETSGSNTQGGFIGDGWDYTPGFVERSYQGCSHDGITGSGDLCWGGANATLSLGSHSSQLVQDSAGNWHLKNDDGTTVQLLTGAPNGLWHGQYWLVTTTDGTQYYFGRDHLPGGSGSDPTTNAAWGEPVYSPSSGDPCYSSSTGQGSECSMGWRWNLDFVVDPMQRLTVYNYASETNYYSMGGGQNGGNGTLTQYVRGGYPTSISYGYLLPDAIAGASPAAKVLFGASRRCLSSASTCDANENGTYWPDVPWDQNCGSSGSCTNYSPTFWSTRRLTSVTTQVRESGTYQTVDSWALTQTFPVGAGSSPVMELDTVTRTGSDGGSAALPSLQITTSEMDNRVDGLTPSAPPVYRPRISGMTTEAGALITVTYDPPGCSRLNNVMPAHPYDNTLPCFPVYWTPPGMGQIQDWFLKTLVAQVSVSDQSGAGSRGQLTSYSYLGGAAWHYDNNPLVPSSNRTWDQYRGYHQIQTSTGTAPDPITESVQTYMQGMDGDNNGTGGTRSVNVSDTVGDSFTDSDWLAGQVLETDVYTASGGTIARKDVAGPWTWTQTADQNQSGGLPDLTAHMLASSQQRTFSLFADGNWHTDKSTTYYNGNGQPAAVDHAPQGGPETCSSTFYATPPSGDAMMQSYPDQVTAVTGSYNTSSNSCPAPSSTDIVSDARTYYDDSSSTLSSMGTLGALTYPGGLATGTSQATAWPSPGSEAWQPRSATGYDSLGRVTSATTPTPNGASGTDKTTTAYTPAYASGSAGTELPTSIKVTSPLGWSTTTAFDQGREQPTKVTDPNGEVTTEAYDALGRRTYVITPIDQASGDKSITFAYSLTGTAPSAVTTSTLREDGSYSTDVKIYDGMLQQVQEQATPANGATGRVITDTFYDSHGWVTKSRRPYYDATTAPGSTMFIVGDGSIPGWTATSYDGMGRVTAATFESGNAAQWTTTTAYPGLNRTDVTPPAGGTATSSFVNVLGQLTASWQYTTAAPDGNAADADVTSYAYTPAGQLATINDNAGNTWTFGYDLAGEKISASSPAATAHATWAYDGAGNVASSTDPRGQQLSYAYDLAGRQTAEYAGTLSGTRLAAWTWDTSPLNGGAGAKGQLASASSYDTAGGASGGPYTETVAGYNTAYEPTGTSTSIPAKDLVPGAAGTDTFTTTSTYTPLTGLLATTAYSADHGLPAETVNFSFDLQGELISYGGATAYLDQAVYDPLGQLQRTTYGLFGKQLVQTYTRDPGTGWLTGATTNLQTLTSAADTMSFTHDPAGLVTSVTDAQNTGGTQGQCYTYNHLSELTAAWTDTKGTTTSPAPSVTGIGGCVTTTPTASTIGGAAPYWQTYTYDLLGDRTQAVNHDTTGNTANDITQTMTYPGGGTSPATQPDAPTSIVTRRGGSGGPSTTLTPAYDAAGNTTGRTVTATSGTNPPAGPPAASSISYGPAGRTATVTTSGGTSGYTYDASENLLLQTGPGSNIAYVDGGAEQLTWNRSTGKITAQRYYPGPDGTTIVRSYDNNTAKTTITDETASPQHTAVDAIDASTQAITRRHYDPYGNLVGAIPTSWPDNHAYLGKPSDPNTSLDLLGARNYDPATGSFLSSDPVTQPGSPLTLGGYAYAADNPASNADPSGLMLVAEGGGGACSSALIGCPGYTPPPAAPSSSGGCGFLGFSCAWHFATDFAGGVKDTTVGMVKGAWNFVTTPARDLWHCVTGSLGGCGNVLLDAIGIRPAMQIAQGIVGTGISIYRDFASGHTGRALGSLTTFAALILITRGAGAEADAAAADSGAGAGAGPGAGTTAGTGPLADTLRLVNGERTFRWLKQFDENNMGSYDAGKSAGESLEDAGHAVEQPTSASGTTQQVGSPGGSATPYVTGTVNDPLILPAAIATTVTLRILQLVINKLLGRPQT